jgi:hypothetical protein
MPDQGAVRTASDLPRMLAGLMNCPVVVSLKVLTQYYCSPGRW